MKVAKEVKQLLTPKKESAKRYLSFGSTLMNLACANRLHGAIPEGQYVLFVGDTDSGKTWACLAALAEAANSKDFKNHRLIYDAPEGGALMDIRKYFGKEVFNKLEPPAVDKDGNPIYSDTVESFYYLLDDAIAAGKPFIYVLDSVDSLNTKADEKKFKELKAAYRKGNKETTGTFGTAKAKTHSDYVRKIPSRLKPTGSILIVINQSRDNISAGPFGERKTRSGGWALEFFATIQLWSSIKFKIKEQVSEKKKLQKGIQCRIRVKRSRVTGKDRTVEFPIYHSVGIDDVGSLVDYLVDWGHWSVSKKVIDAKEFNWQLKREPLVEAIESANKEKELANLVKEVWEEVEEKVAVKRKPRYK